MTMTTPIHGFWTGTIIYGKEYGKQHPELYFELDLHQEGDQISGLAADTGGAGMHPDPAQIRGTFNGNQIDFVKQYPGSHYSYIGKENETIIDKLKPGHLIYYTGIYNPQEDCFYGTWVIPGKRRMFGFIPIRYQSTGTWTMRRKVTSPF